MLEHLKREKIMSQTCSNLQVNINSNNLNYLKQKSTQWKESKKELQSNPSETTILLGGMTILQDKLVASALSSLGGRYVALPNADFKSFQIGKSLCNRGECNPVYFTVGNLIKYLQELQKEKGLSSHAIIKKYVFLTAGSCGPCRFGMYLTEYKKALEEAGFNGFRIINFEHNSSIFQKKNMDKLVHFSPNFFILIVKAIIIGDILNILTSKLRPYEVNKGETDTAIIRCQEIIANAFKNKKSLLIGMYQCRKILDKVKLNYLQVKPKVLITGEFWASLVDGDGNYNLHRFLESEGAECIPQPLINRLLLSLWEAEYETTKRQDIYYEHNKLIDFSTLKKKLLLKLGKTLLKSHFSLYANAIGLNEYRMANMDKLASLAKEYYPMDASGGEAHLEVAHLIECEKEKLAHMVISVKPFGCMPSSAVSDGIQSLVTTHYPSMNFLSIETSGESATNFYSRVQMTLFKAKKLAEEEFQSIKLSKNI